MVHIRVTQTRRQRFAEHEPSGARLADESCWAVNPVRVQEKSSILRLPGHVLDLLGKGGQVQHHLVVDKLSGGCGLKLVRRNPSSVRQSSGSRVSTRGRQTWTILALGAERRHLANAVQNTIASTLPMVCSVRSLKLGYQTLGSSPSTLSSAGVLRRSIAGEPILDPGCPPPAVFYPPRTPSLSRSGLGKDWSQVAGRGGHTLRRRRCRLSSYARLWPTYSGTATSYQPLDTLLLHFICSWRSLMSDGQRAQRDDMETIKLDSKRNLSKKPVFARECRADRPSGHHH